MSGLLTISSTALIIILEAAQLTQWTRTLEPDLDRDVTLSGRPDAETKN